MSRRRMSAVCAALCAVSFSVSTVARADSDNAKNCVGAAVSDAAHFTQDFWDIGFGKYFTSQGMTPAEAIKAYAEFICGKH